MTSIHVLGWVIYAARSRHGVEDASSSGEPSGTFLVLLRCAQRPVKLTI